MTIGTSPRKAGPYLPTEHTTTFPFSFKVFAASDLVVIQTDAAGAETTLAMTTDYTVSLNSDQDTSPGGTITKLVALTAGKLTITTDVPESQPTGLSNVGAYYPKVVERALDRLTILVQQLSEKVGRSIKVNISSSSDPDELISELTTAASAAQTAAASAADSAADAAAAAQAAEEALGNIDPVETQIHAATTQNPPVDADEFGFWASVGGALKKCTWAQIKTALGSMFMEFVYPGDSGNVLTSNGEAWESVAPVSSGVPAGSIIYVAKNTAPAGTLKANGAAISRTTYATLFSEIGTTFGIGDGSTTFNLPDLRGEFIRSWDDAKGTDSGRVFGSAQTDLFKSHAHNLAVYEGTFPSNAYPSGGMSPGSAVAAQTTGSVGGTETRPRNVALLACIKY